MTVELQADAMDTGTADAVPVSGPANALDRTEVRRTGTYLGVLIADAAERVRAVRRAIRRAVDSFLAAIRAWFAEQRRTIGSTGVKLAIASSVAMFAGFAAYHFGTLGMLGSDIVFYYAMLVALLYCSLAYQFNRFGASRRREEQHSVAAAEIPWRAAEEAPSVTILVPTYREERRVLIGTVLSAALAEYANRRIVVLVDDSPSDKAAVGSTLSAIGEVTGWVSEQATRMRGERDAWLSRRAAGTFDAEGEARRLSLWREALRVWRLVHVPCSILLLALAALHVLAVWRY